MDKPNLITLAWAGVINSDPPMVSVSIRKSRYSHQQIVDTREFVINLVNQPLLKATDYCGVKSGRETDKFADCELTPVTAEGLSIAPAVAQSVLSLSCQVRQIMELGSHDCFIAEIIAVQAATELFDKQGRLRLDKAGLVAFSHGHYYGLGEMLGFFGFSVASKKVLAKRMPKKVKGEE
ncbi:MAG TPA: flavin reductase family protein [Clostridiales bacterium]|nr:flavin reductase family protein [Clostridiales bacterium]